MIAKLVQLKYVFDGKSINTAPALLVAVWCVKMSSGMLGGDQPPSKISHVHSF